MGFHKDILWKYGKVCRLFSEWAMERHYNDVSEEILRQYAIEHIGYWEVARNLSYGKRITLMILRRWMCFIKGLPYEYRIPAIHYQFNTEIGLRIDDYLNWCRQHLFRRPATIISKRSILFRLDQYLFSNGIALKDLRADLADKYFMDLALGQRKTHKSTIREFLKYCFENGLTSRDLSIQILKEPRYRKPERLPSTYTTEEIMSLLNGVDRSTPKGKRDYLVVMLCAHYGIRASDIVRLCLDNFDWEKNVIRLRQYKTDVDIELPLIASVGNAVIDYLKHGHPSPGSGFLIVSHMRGTIGQPLDRVTIHSIVTQAFRNSDIIGWEDRRHGPHSLRHSLASNLLKQDVGLMTISAALGHKSSESTKLYVKIDIENLRKCGLDIPEIKNPWLKNYNKKGGYYETT